MNDTKTSEERKALHAQLKELKKDHDELQKKALQAEEEVLQLTANELRELHQRLKRTNRSLSRLFTGPRR